jgi:hypothetical protein
MEHRREDAPDYGEWVHAWWRPRSAPTPLPDVAPPPAYRAVLDATAVHGERRFAGHPSAADGWPPSLRLCLRPDEPANGPTPPAVLPPELLPFARIAAGTVGWIVPAPELGFDDFPVGLVTTDDPGVVHELGADTRAGFGAALGVVLRETDGRRGPAIDLMTAALDLGPIEPSPAPDRLGTPVFDTARYRGRYVGYRHEPLPDGLGVLGPDVVRDRPPPDAGDPAELARCYDRAVTLLDRGAAGSALLVIKELYAAAPGCWVATLAPLWAAAYLDLARPHLLPRLELLRRSFGSAPCACPVPHPEPAPHPG